MATSGIVAEGLRELIRDLGRIDKSLSREARRALKAAGEPVLEDARRRSKTFGPTLKISTARGGVSIRSNHPGARVSHWGLRHPLFGNRDRWYSNPKKPFIAEAAAAKGGEALEILGDEMEKLFTRHGFK